MEWLRGIIVVCFIFFICGTVFSIPQRLVDDSTYQILKENSLERKDLKDVLGVKDFNFVDLALKSDGLKSVELGSKTMFLIEQNTGNVLSNLMTQINRLWLIDLQNRFSNITTSINSILNRLTGAEAKIIVLENENQKIKNCAVESEDYKQYKECLTIK
jgi:hypothetical protein